MRVADVLAKGMMADHKKGENQADQSQSDWDPSEAVECILAKVRDLPGQLTSFMKVSLNWMVWWVESFACPVPVE